MDVETLVFPMDFDTHSTETSPPPATLNPGLADWEEKVLPVPQLYGHSQRWDPAEQIPQWVPYHANFLTREDSICVVNGCPNWDSPNASILDR